MTHAPPRLRVDVATGATHLDAIDLALPGPIPLAVARHYRSDDARGGAFGPGWRLGLDAALVVTADRIAVEGGPFDGAAFAPVETGRAAVQEATGLVIEHLADAYVVFASRRRQFVFLKRLARGDRLPLAAVRDGRGQVVHVERAGGRIVEVREPLGRTLAFTYRGDTVDRIDLLAPGAQPETVARYRYAGGRLRSAAGADGRAEQVDTDGGYVTTHQTRGGSRSHAQYAADGRCLALWRDDGATFRLAYDDLRQTTRVLDASGGQTLFRHVATRQVLERIDPEGASHNVYYDEAERMIGHGTAAGVRTFQRLDPAERRLAHLDRERRIAFVQYAESGVATASEDAFDHVTRLHTDEALTVVGIEAPDDTTWTIERDERGRVASVVSSEGRTAQLAWARDTLTVSDAEGTRWRETLDAFGRVTARVDRTGRREARRTDAAGRLVEVRVADGPAIEFLYDADGHLVSVVESDGHRTRLVRDAAGTVVGEDETPDRSVRLARDAAGRIVGARDGQGRALRLSYTPHGRLAAITGGLDATYRYDGGETTVRDARGWRRYAFTGDLAEWQDASGAHQRFDWGPSGELMSWEHTRDGETVAALYPEYDACGRLATLSGRLPTAGSDRPADVEARLRYDCDGALTALLDGDDVALALHLDALARPVCVEAEGVLLRLRYDGAGRLVGLEGIGDAVEIAYDGFDRVEGVRQGDRTLDLRETPDAVWDTPLDAAPISAASAAETSSAPPDMDGARPTASPLLRRGGGQGEVDQEDATAFPSVTLSLRAERRGVAMFAHLGPLTVPLLVRTERRCPDASPTARCLAAAMRGPAAVFPTVAEGEALLARFLPDARRDLRTDPTCVPHGRDLGLPGDVLDAFVLDPSHRDALRVEASMQPHHQADASRGPFDLLTGPHRRGVLRPSPWHARSLRALFPAPDLLAPDGAPTASAVLDFVDRRG